MTHRSISRLISARADATPDEVILQTAGGHESPTITLTADELDRAGNRFARDLHDRGVRPDDLVAVALPTSVDFVIVCTAIWKLGATPAPIPPTMVAEERAALECLDRPALVVGTAPIDPTIPWVPTGHVPDESIADDRLPDAWASCWKAPTSSGSSGRPKIVRATASARFDPDDVVAPFLPRGAVQLVTVPLWHSASFTYAFRGLMTDHCLVLADRFDDHRFGAIVERHGVTWTLLSPSMIHRLLRAPASCRSGADVSSISSVLHLGAPCPEEDKLALMAWLGPERVVEVYAGTESNGLTMIDGDEWLAHRGSVGRPVGGTRIEIRGDDGVQLRAGVQGQIWMRRDGDPRYTYVGADTRRTVDGWDTLGDMGFLDEDGYLTVVGRQTEAMTCGDRTLFPAQLERGIIVHPAVRDAVVYDTTDDDGARRLCAAVDIADTEVDPTEIEAFTLRHLARYCATGGVRVGRRPVRNEAGKVRRTSLADCET